MTSSAAETAAVAGRDGATQVHLRVSDPLTAAGLRRWLRVAEQAHAVREGEACDVIVLGPRPMPTAWLRRTVATVRAETGAGRVVVIVDGAGAAVPAAAELGCDAVLVRAALDQASFLAAISAGTDDRSAGEGPAQSVDDADERAAIVLRMLADGHDLAEIAAALFYSERTVKNVLYSYLGKVGARNRVHAVACAIRAGIV